MIPTSATAFPARRRRCRLPAGPPVEVAQGGGLMPLVGWLKAQLARLATRRGEFALARSLLAQTAELATTLGTQAVKPAAETRDAPSCALCRRRISAKASPSSRTS